MAAGSSCAAYDFCSGSNCKGSCDIFPAANYTRQNSYPSVVCMKRGPFDYPNQAADLGNALHRPLMGTMPVF